MAWRPPASASDASCGRRRMRSIWYAQFPDRRLVCTRHQGEPESVDADRLLDARRCAGPTPAGRPAADQPDVVRDPAGRLDAGRAGTSKFRLSCDTSLFLFAGFSASVARFARFGLYQTIGSRADQLDPVLRAVVHISRRGVVLLSSIGASPIFASAAPLLPMVVSSYMRAASAGTFHASICRWLTTVAQATVARMPSI